MNTGNTLIDILTSKYMPTEYSNLNLKDDKDYEKFSNMITELEKSYSDLTKTFNSLFGKTFVSNFDTTILNNIKTLKDAAKKINDNAHKCSGVTSSCNEVDDVTPEKPSSKLSKEMYDKISDITNEYVKTMILPYAEANKLSDDTIKGAYDGLFEFAAWIYTK